MSLVSMTKPFSNCPTLNPAVLVTQLCLTLLDPMDRVAYQTSLPTEFSRQEY